jgi:uncharacterized membrane protein YbhN (UPF0104 family)
VTRSLAIGAVIAIVVYVAFAFYLDLSKLTREVERVSLHAVASAIGLATLSFALRFARWHYLLTELGVQPALGDSALIFTSGLGLSITPGKVGELLKVFMMKQATGASATVTAPVVLAERIGDLFALLILAACALASGPAGWLIGGAVVVAVAGGSLVLSSQRMAAALIELACKLPFLRSWRERLLAASSSFATMFAPKRFLISLALGCAAWLIHCLAFAAIARDMIPGGFGLRASILANAAPLLIGAAAMVPGGLGVAELSMAGVIIAFAKDTSPATAGAVTFVVRLTTLWWAVALGGCALIAWRVRVGRAGSSRR